MNKESGKRMMPRKLFFLHIPKNAGSFVNHIASTWCANSQVHIESERSTKYANIDIRDVDYISGHVLFEEVQRYLDLRGYLKVTLLRDPIDQLISHLNWVMRLSENVDGALFASKPRETQELALYIRSVNWNDAAGIQSFIRGLSDYGHNLFNNCQTRYLSTGPCKLQYDVDDARLALANTEFFDLVGIVERLDSFIEKLSFLMGWTNNSYSGRVNSMGNRYRIGGFEEFADAVAPLVEADDFLYKSVLAKLV